MAVSDFFNGAIREFAYRNYPVSMACSCICLDATAKLDTGLTGVRRRCTAFIDRYLDIVTLVGSGGGCVSMPGSIEGRPNPCKLGTSAPIQEIIYESVRCALIHEASLATNVSFVDRAFLGLNGTTFEMSTRMVVALLLAVAASPKSAGIHVDESWGIILDNRQIPFNSLMGDRKAVTDWLGLTPNV